MKFFISPIFPILVFLIFISIWIYLAWPKKKKNKITRPTPDYFQRPRTAQRVLLNQEIHKRKLKAELPYRPLEFDDAPEPREEIRNYFTIRPLPDHEEKPFVKKAEDDLRERLRNKT